MKNKEGKVYLVGAGPGDPELITLKGQRLLQEADVVVFDYLVNPVILQGLSATAERIFIGKPRQGGRLSQREVNDLLIAKARSGRKVVRLKGGDPFIFGRGAEEAEALVTAGIEWELVPGISAGHAVPAYAGIPLTHREYASSVAFVTGHESDDKPISVDWHRLAHAVETIVIFMSVKTLHEIVTQLVAAGKALATPVAVIQQGTLEQQKVVQGTLGQIVDLAEDARIKSPALTVVGDVVTLRKQLNWFHPGQRPLPESIEVKNEILAALSFTA